MQWQYIDSMVFIRPIIESDLTAVLEVYHQCEDFLALGPDPYASPEMVAKDRALSLQESGIYCGIFLDDTEKNPTDFENPPGLVSREDESKNMVSSEGELVGILDYVPNYSGDFDAAFIELLMIAAPYRGHGLGKMAVDWLLLHGFSDKAALKRLYAAVQANNPDAIRFWQRMGFRITGPAALQPDNTVTYPLEAIIQPET